MKRHLVLFSISLTIGLLALGGIPQYSPHQTGSAAAHTPIPTAATSPGNQSETAAVREVEDALLVNNNENDLPPGCHEIAGTNSVTVRAGREYAEPGEMFGYDTDRVQAAPCTKLSVTFVNEDSVRHQWMIHGLPRDTYPMGMFSIELTGPGKATGSLIVPSDPGSFRVHCSLLQHEQKGMRADLVVGPKDGETTPAQGQTDGQTEASTGIPGVLWVMGFGLLVLLARRYLKTDRSNTQDE